MRHCTAMMFHLVSAFSSDQLLRISTSVCTYSSTSPSSFIQKCGEQRNAGVIIVHVEMMSFLQNWQHQEPHNAFSWSKLSRWLWYPWRKLKQAVFAHINSEAINVSTAALTQLEQLHAKSRAFYRNVLLEMKAALL